MVITVFDPSLDLIYTQVEIASRRTDDRSVLRFLFVLDTACAETLITPDVADELGYSVREAEGISTVTSAIGKESGWLLRVPRLTALGHSLQDLRVNVHDLPEQSGIDGLLGLNFLRHFNYEIRSQEGVIRTEPA